MAWLRGCSRRSACLRSCVDLVQGCGACGCPVGRMQQGGRRSKSGTRVASDSANKERIAADGPAAANPAAALLRRPQAEAQQLVATVAAAAEGYPFVPPEWMPSVLVPTVGLIVPAIGMAWVSSRLRGAGLQQGWARGWAEGDRERAYSCACVPLS